MANRFSGPRSARRGLACKLGRPPLRPDPAKAPQRTAAVASFLNKVTADMPVPVKAISVEDPGLEITLRAAALSPDTALPRTVQGGGLGSEVASIRRILIEWRPKSAAIVGEEVMHWSKLARGGFVAVALCCFACREPKRSRFSTGRALRPI